MRNNNLRFIIQVFFQRLLWAGMIAAFPLLLSETLRERVAAGIAYGVGKVTYVKNLDQNSITIYRDISKCSIVEKVDLRFIYV
ncbi:MAG: hypothetical protein HWQ41_12430 [Nostoc sp. NOS(2021)]|uniref:hypothetical protein n=1 Tax=Nostoc sp. NOS(2021) TaxID=2815407 RepID=UPI0025F19024|nr:hypothetical protein [Nostoc sp. NOS(2021)]MBN3896035.1 hypothetical protein [Nostoc sp. NOS(2021)]